MKDKMQLLPIETVPFMSLNYTDKEAEKEWSPRIKRCTSVIKSVEINLVERGYREAATTLVSRADMADELRRLNERGLVLTVLQWIKKFDGYAHTHSRTTPDDPDALCYGVVSRTERVGLQFKKATEGLNTDHDTIGGLLGYPKCCRDFFNKVWKLGYIDPIWQQALNSGGAVRLESHGGYAIDVSGYPECSAMQRYWGIRVSFHLPCSFTCEATKKMAGIWLNEAAAIDKDVPDLILQLLSLRTAWDAHKGVAIVNTPHFKGTAGSVPCADMHTVYYEAV